VGAGEGRRHRQTARRSLGLSGRGVLAGRQSPASDEASPLEEGQPPASDEASPFEKGSRLPPTKPRPPKKAAVCLRRSLALQKSQPPGLRQSLALLPSQPAGFFAEKCTARGRPPSSASAIREAAKRRTAPFQKGFRPVCRDHQRHQPNESGPGATHAHLLDRPQRSWRDDGPAPGPRPWTFRPRRRYGPCP
jgi:hypothetical protein